MGRPPWKSVAIGAAITGNCPSPAGGCDCPWLSGTFSKNGPLRSTVRNCNAAQCNAMQCNAMRLMQRNATQRNATQRNATQRNAMQCMSGGCRDWRWRSETPAASSTVPQRACSLLSGTVCAAGISDRCIAENKPTAMSIMKFEHLGPVGTLERVRRGYRQTWCIFHDWPAALERTQ